MFVYIVVLALAASIDIVVCTNGEDVCGIDRFTCGDGACVSWESYCDGVQHCADNSDEEGCIQHSNKLDPIPETVLHRNKRQSTHGSKGSCVLPDYPEHGTYTVNGVPGARPGQSYPSAYLTVTCDPGYEVVGSNYTYCFSGIGWRRSIPYCISRSCKLSPHPSVNYKCKVIGIEGQIGTRMCNKYEPSGTVIIPECSPDYYYPSGVRPNMRCIDGNWDSTVICQPECGRSTPDGMPLVVNGTQARRGELPWHAGIFSKSHRPFMQICGGSLVTSTLVISVAHCFWKSGRLAPPRTYAVALGKIYRHWDETMDVDAQKSDVSSIKTQNNYGGVQSYFANDIALITLSTPIIYTPFIRPICIDFDVDFDRRQLQPGNLGKVSGWGLTSEDGKPSAILQTVELPYVDVVQCIRDLPRDFRPYITSDKICAGTMNGTAICAGDGGGGLAFPTVDSRGLQRYYLRGLISTAPRNDHACNVHSYAALTHLQRHALFFMENLNTF